MEIHSRLFAVLAVAYTSVPTDSIHIVIHDVRSELDLKLLTKGIALSSEEYFRWVYRGARWKLNNILKESKRFAPLEEAEEVVDDFDIVHVMEKEEVIDEALKVLTDKERAILLMQSYFNFSYKRIANICGVTTHAIKAVLTNAKRKMQSVANPPNQ